MKQRPDSSPRPLFIKLAIFIGLLSIPFWLLIGIALYTGEILPMNVVAARQHNTEGTSIFSSGDRAAVALSYRLAMIHEQQPDLMLFGSSRLLRVPTEFFDPGITAYNAAIPALSITEARQFLTRLTDQRDIPKIVIFGVDLPWFNSEYLGFQAVNGIRYIQPEFDLTRTIERLAQTYNQLIVNGNLTWEVLTSKDDDIVDNWIRIGNEAWTTNTGFLQNGRVEHKPNAFTPKSVEDNIHDHLDLLFINNGRNIYQWGDTLDETAFQQLESILQWAQANHVTLIGFLPPYATVIYEEMHNSGHFTYQDLARPRIQDLFEQYNMPFVDYSNFNWVGGNDYEMFDGWHMSTGATARVLKALIEDVPVLAEYVQSELVNQFIEAMIDPHDALVRQDGKTPQEIIAHLPQQTNSPYASYTAIEDRETLLEIDEIAQDARGRVIVSGWSIDATAGEGNGTGINFARAFAGTECSGDILGTALPDIRRPGVEELQSFDNSYRHAGFEIIIPKAKVSAHFTLTVCAHNRFVEDFDAQITREVTLADLDIQ